MSAAEAGVFARRPDGSAELIHAYDGGEYGLEDIPELFQLGKIEPGGTNVRLRLSQHELRQLKMMADAYSFDYEPRFIDMCRDIVHFGSSAGAEPVWLEANF